jgi:ribonuclease Z
MTAGEKTTRRSVLAGAAALLAAVAGSMSGKAAGAENSPRPDEVIVTLLGTGSPVPSTTRFGPATLVQAGGLNLLFDAGRGSR